MSIFPRRPVRSLRVSGDRRSSLASTSRPRMVMLTPSADARCTTRGRCCRIGFLGDVGGTLGGGELLYLPHPPLGNWGATFRAGAVHCTQSVLPFLSRPTIPRAPEIPLRPASYT